MKNSEKNLPTLSDSDMVTENVSRKPKRLQSSIKLSSVAIALSLTTAFVTMPSCADLSDCDSDITRYADPTDTGAYDTGWTADPYDYGSYDVTTRGDVACD
jgi:hypothetical protein